jgi:RNA polymerase sigma factor (TIGR02999 family)
MVYEELRRMAHHYMSRERPGHTMQTTALVNEAYLRLVNREAVHWQNRAHFFAIAAQVMRHILVDHARGHAYAKRGCSSWSLARYHQARVEHRQSLAVSRIDQR